MKRKWESLIKVISLLPTPRGWKAFDTWCDEDSYHHQERSIVGFGTVRRFERLEGDRAWRQEESDQVEPLLFNDEFKAALPMSDYKTFFDGVTTIVPPGATFDEDKAIEELKGETK